MMLFWPLLIVGGAALIAWLMRGGRMSQRSEPPLEILRKRYARGEISREEYDQMRRDLEGG
jgi:putative membrane protein